MKILILLSLGLGSFLTHSSSAGTALDPKTTAVVLVDMQPIYCKSAEHTAHFARFIRRQQDLLNWAVSRQVPVLVFEMGFTGTLERPAETYESLMKIVRCTKHEVRKKFTENGFHQTFSPENLRLLRRWGIESLIISGVNAPICVAATALGACLGGYDVYTSSDIVGICGSSVYYPYLSKEFHFNHPKFRVFDSLDEILNP